MPKKIKRVVWVRQAREALTAILEYRYLEIPTAYEIVKKEIIDSSKKIIFSEQYQADDIFPEYRRIIVREYKILYTEKQGIAYILNVVCTKAQ
jgi:plasmid stabilization system protein ParE